jgi:4-amino-4-deoxy-L-arabinose transferase-like glycosyltransferase
MNGRNNSLLRAAFYSLWFLLAVLQAYNTELLADEAYYRKYAQELSWGYFDHPPVVAALIKAGYAILQNELGVRLLFILMNIGFLLIIENLVQPKRLLPYYLAISSIGAFQLLGVLALPDMPLLFFTAAFLWAYKRYLHSDSISNAALLACIIALLLLSKYHGILVIAFTILAHPAIVKRTSFWMLAVVSVALFIPHVYWQLNHGMPSVAYHLSERSAEPYKIEFTLNYLLSILMIFGPVVALVFAWVTIKSKPTGIFDRTLKYLLTGTLAFFFLMTFKGH